MNWLSLMINANVSDVLDKPSTLAKFVLSTNDVIVDMCLFIVFLADSIVELWLYDVL